jgi:hypothetical protein
VCSLIFIVCIVVPGVTKQNVDDENPQVESHTLDEVDVVDDDFDVIGRDNGVESVTSSPQHHEDTHDGMLYIYMLTDLINFCIILDMFDMD